MADNLQELPQLSGCATSSFSVHQQKSVTINVVRNVVVNMESVLTDLKGIMGEITNIVDHIDTVTGKVDSPSKNRNDNKDLQLSKHEFTKSLCGKYSESKLLSVHMATPVDASVTLADEPSQIYHANPNKEVLQVTGSSKHQDIFSPTQNRKYEGMAVDRCALRDRQNSSQKCNQLVKHGGVVVSQSAAIAVVHPTIINRFQAISSKEGTEALADIKPTMSTDNLHTDMFISHVHNISKCTINFSGSSKSINHEMESQYNEDTECKQDKTEETDGMPFTSPADVLSVTREDYQPLLTAAKEKHLHSLILTNTPTNLNTLAESCETLPATEPVRHDITCSRNMKTKPKSTSFHSRQFKTTVDTDFVQEVSNLSNNQDIAFRSPLLRHSSPKLVYRKVESSPVSVRSLNARRGWEAKNHSCSTESDADSDSLVESHDIRNVTPDIDWSYLNLVGNRSSLGNLSSAVESDNHKEKFSTCQTCAPPHSYFFPNKSERTCARPQLETTEQSNDTPSLLIHRYITENPMVLHVFCSEVISSSMSAGYCGFYEAILDAVLENIAGFESFEDACEAIESTEDMNETYVSYDTDFEEDSWDLGMRSVDEDEYELPSSDIQDYTSPNFERFDFLDGNKNVLSAKFVENQYQNRNTDSLINLETDNETLCIQRNKQNPPVIATNMEDKESFKFPTDNTLNLKNQETLIIDRSNLNQNLNFCLESIHSMKINVKNDQTTKCTMGDLQRNTSLTDITSCPTDGSPMSFNSIEITNSSPETDHVEFASEEDLYSTQSDSASLSSELGYDAKICIHKAKLKRLRREFFLSLYRKCEDGDLDLVDNEKPVTSLDETAYLGQRESLLDNSRDNVSESGSYLDNMTAYNRSLNTWTAYAIVDTQTDEISDTTSDIFNDNN